MILTAPLLRHLWVTCELCGCRMVLERAHPRGERIVLICHACEEPLIVDWGSWVDRR